MIKLLRGDDAKHLISLELPEVAFTEGMTVIFEIGGLKVTAPAAPSIEVQFPSTWTALQPCGRILGSWKIRDRNGNIGTLTKTFPVYLTDDVGEITSGSIVSGNVKPVVDFSDIAELTTSATPGDVKAALNEILRRLKTGLNCLLIAFAIPAFSAELTPDTIMDDVPGPTTISELVTAAGITVGGGTDGEAVTNIVNGIVKGKRDYTDLSYIQLIKRTGTAYVMSIYDKSGQTLIKTVALPKYSERTEGIYEQRAYQVYLDGKTYLLSCTFGFSQEWAIVISNNGRIETYHKWTRSNDGNQTPDFETNDGRNTFVLSYKTSTQIAEDNVDTIALSSDVKITTDQLSANLRTIKSDVDTVKSDLGTATTNANEALELAGDVATLVYGDDCRLISTYYNSVTRMPYLSLQFKMKDEVTGTNFWYKVWDEMTRFNHIIDHHLPTNYYNKTEIDVALDEKADRAWGHYDSHTGAYAPYGYTWVSSPYIAIAGGMSYQRVISSNDIFVLSSNGLVTELGGDASSTNGFFRISDDKGNTIFEITKGTASLMPATADDISVTNIMGVAHLYIPYKVECPEAPKVIYCTDLLKKDWKREDEEGFQFNVNWTGESGNWIAEVWAKEPSVRGFVKAEYKQGARDTIKHLAPVSFSDLEFNGKVYHNLRVEEMNGKKVLVVD